nr:hydrogenobyrinic acid a,c-diamide synthase (glutamine-hydrolyzing) [Desulfobacterales bacterium]
MFTAVPRITIAALRGGSGKTILSLGIIAALRDKGHVVAPFKKGPDFIDASWLTLAAGRSCHNLDPFLMTHAQIVQSFVSHSKDADISVIEGNRGLFDGFDVNGRCSTAELGKLLKTPVIIVVDVTMTSRTIAAVILGCQKFDPDLEIGAVILNRVAGSRQESIITRCVERYCEVPVVGAVPKFKGGFFPERHMGLVPYQEREHANRAISWAKAIVESYLDMDEIFRLMHRTTPLNTMHIEQDKVGSALDQNNPPRIGFIRDRSFWFYYPENLEHLRNLGAELVEIDSITEDKLPDIDALYIGGGFPETQAEALADNKGFRDSLREKIELGLPVYAECGGFMYLGETIIVDEKTYPMVGVLPIRFTLHEKPQGHGYTILEVSGDNPFYSVGEVLRGHEFHYSKAVFSSLGDIRLVFKVHRGCGIDGERDGICKKNLLATYTHIHSGGNSLWGEGFFKSAVMYKKGMKCCELDRLK